MSSYAIAKMLNSEGIRTRHGKLFDTTRKNPKTTQTMMPKLQSQPAILRR